MLTKILCLQLFLFSNLSAFPQSTEVLGDVFGSDLEEDVTDLETEILSDVFGDVIDCSTLQGYR